MGPGIDTNNTAEKEKAFLASIENVYPQTRSYYRGIDILKDGRIICYDYLSKEVKLYKYIDNKFILDFEFLIDHVDCGATSLYEVEENIILFGSYQRIFLYDIRDNQAKLIQTIEFNYMNYVIQFNKLSNGLIAATNCIDIIFYKYDEQTKKIEKIDEIKTGRAVDKFFETNEGNIVVFSNKEIFLYDKNKNIQTRINIDKDIPSFNFLDGEYIFVSSRESQNSSFKFNLDVYNIKNFRLMQTLEVKYYLVKFLKLKDNLLIVADTFGNIHEINIDKDFKLSVKDIFRAHDNPISDMHKFDDNKVLSISHDGKIKLWEFN